MRALCLAAFVSLLGLTAQAQQCRHNSPCVASSLQARQLHRDSESASEGMPKSSDGVILNAFPDLTPRSGAPPEEPQQQTQPPLAPARRPARRGLPTPQWRRNPLMPLSGKTTET